MLYGLGSFRRQIVAESRWQEYRSALMDEGRQQGQRESFPNSMRALNSFKIERSNNYLTQSNRTRMIPMHVHCLAIRWQSRIRQRPKDHGSQAAGWH